MRLPMGSVLLSSSGTSMPPRICVRGAVFDSTTLIHGFNFNEPKYSAAVRMSASVAFFAVSIISCGGRMFGSDDLRSPFLKSFTC
jgi:hypothetical protein